MKDQVEFKTFDKGVNIDDVENGTQRMMLTYIDYANKRMRLAVDHMAETKKADDNDLYVINSIMMGYNHFASVLQKINMIKQKEREMAVVKMEQSIYEER